MKSVTDLSSIFGWIRLPNFPDSSEFGGPKLFLVAGVSPKALRQGKEAVAWEAILALMDDDNA